MSSNDILEKSDSSTPEEILDKIKGILSEQFNVEKEKIIPETDLINDLNADSLDVVDLAEIVEDEFEIKISDDEIESFHTVNDIFKYITKLINN